MERLRPQSSAGAKDHFERSRLIHNSLFDLHKKQLPSDFQYHRDQVAKIIARCNAERHIQPHLAHSHFLLEKGEVMLGQAVQLAAAPEHSDAPTPSAIQTAPTPVEGIDQADHLYPHVLGWDTDEKGTLHPFPYLYRIRPQGGPPPPVDFNSDEVLRLVTDYVAEHRLQHLITLEIVLEEEQPEHMVEFIFSSCVFSISAAGVPNASDPAYQIQTSWRVERKNGTVCSTGLESYYLRPGQPHITFKDEKAMSPPQLFEVLKREKVWDEALWAQS